jgi:uncharacterized protein with PIN domain
MPETLRFGADVHLGKLARLLRMLGFDTVYKNNFSKEELYEIARKEHRCLLSKASYFLKLPGIIFYQIKSPDSAEQLKEVINYFDLANSIKSFTRCLNCNEILKSKEKEEVAELLLPETKKHFSEFWKCPCCNKIYWKGSHYDRMLKLVEKLLN